MNVVTPASVSAPEPATEITRLRSLLCSVLVALAAAGAVRLGTFDFILPNLDPSWRSALGGAAARGDVFGRDIIFTGGPLTALYTSYFDPVQWPYVLLARLLLLGALAWSCARIAANWSAVLLLAFTVCVAYRMNALFLAIPALAALAALHRRGTPGTFIVLQAIAAAAVLLAKFTPIAVALVAFVAIDVTLLAARRIPIATAAFALAVLGWFALLEGGLTDFGNFVRYSIETSAGYTAAMAIAGTRLELAAFIVIAIGFVGLAAVRAWRAIATGDAARPLAMLAVVATLLFTAFKAAFVRHDLHGILGWQTLALVTAAYVGLERGKLTRSLAMLCCFVSLAVGFALIGKKDGLSPQSIVVNALRQIGSNVTGLAAVVHDPGQWLKAQQAQAQSARAAVRAAQPLPPIKGTVDVLPSMQSAVIAAGMDYRPRFTVQEYTTYTRALIDKNRQSWFGSRAPDHILFGLTPIDARLPALSEGPLWPDLLRYYEPTARWPSLVVLSLRRQPLPNLLGAPSHRVMRLGEAFPLAQQPTFISLDIHYSLVGHVMTVLFKPPQVNLRLTFAGSGSRVYRLVPEIARAGFVIAPQIGSAKDYLALALGDRAAFPQDAWPVSATVESLGPWAYGPAVEVTAQPIDLAPLAAARPPSLPDAAR